jgi:hypothetical protein
MPRVYFAFDTLHSSTVFVLPTTRQNIVVKLALWVLEARRSRVFVYQTSRMRRFVVLVLSSMFFQISDPSMKTAKQPKLALQADCASLPHPR